MTAKETANETPQLESVEQVSEGWINKYILHYRMPDGNKHVYEAVSRKGKADYEARLRAAEASNATGTSDAATSAGNRTTTTPDAVCIVACTPRDSVVMIREFRYPLNSWCMAFPAGLVDEGERIEDAVARELSEETGYELLPGSQMRPLPQAGYSSTGLSDETVQVVFVEAERTVAPHAEPSELIEVFELPRTQIAKFLASNQTPIGTRAQLILEFLKK